MTTNHPSTGSDISGAKFRAARIAEVTAPDRIAKHLAAAEALIDQMDPCDSDSPKLAAVLIECTRAICTALNGRS